MCSTLAELSDPSRTQDDSTTAADEEPDMTCSTAFAATPATSSRRAFGPPSSIDAGAPDGISRSTLRSVRLTRRGRLLVVLLLAGLLLAAFSLGRAGSSLASTTAARPAPVSSTTVHRGETLWAVAQRIAPGSDPRPVIAQLRRLNHLDSAALQVGQQLVVPV